MALKVREICENYNRVVDLACQKVEDTATDAKRKRLSLEIRIYTLTRTRRALVDPSPLAAFLDLWVMTIQRKQYLDGEGEALLGDLTPIVADANRSLLTYIEEVAADVFPPESRDTIKAEVEAHAAANPITGYIRQWQAVEGAHGEHLLKVVTGFVPTLGIKDTAASIADVSRSIDAVGEIVEDIPRLARWNMQLLLLEVDQNPSVVSFRNSIHDISSSVARFNDIVEALPDRVQAEVGKTLDEIEAKQEGIRKTLEDAKGVATEAKVAVEALHATMKDAETTIASAERATEAFALAGERWQPTLSTLLEITGRSSNEPSKGPDPNIENLVKVTNNANAMAAQLNETLGQLRQVLEGKGVDQLNTNARGTVEFTKAQLGDVIDRATWRGVQLAAAIAVLAFLYRLATAKLKR